VSHWSSRERGDAGLRDQLIMVGGIGGHTDRSDGAERIRFDPEDLHTSGVLEGIRGKSADSL